MLGMFALIIVVLLYGCGCLGSSPSTGSKKTLGRPGSGMQSRLFSISFRHGFAFGIYHTENYIFTQIASVPCCR